MEFQWWGLFLGELTILSLAIFFLVAFTDYELGPRRGLAVDQTWSTLRNSTESKKKLYLEMTGLMEETDNSRIPKYSQFSPRDKFWIWICWQVALFASKPSNIFYDCVVLSICRSREMEPASKHISASTYLQDLEGRGAKKLHS